MQTLATLLANKTNIVGPNMLRAFAHHVVCCCVLLRLVGSCWMKFETGLVGQQCCERLHWPLGSAYNSIERIVKNNNNKFVISSERSESERTMCTMTGLSDMLIIASRPCL